MVDLKSVEHSATLSHPTQDTTEMQQAPPTTVGSRGSGPLDRSRADTLLGTGQSDKPLVRRRSALESVIDADDRQRILETELLPWRMICALRITSKVGLFIGTGWLAGPRTVITAGHCVYHLADMGGWASEIEVAPGRNDLTTPYGSTVSRRFAAVDRWTDTQDPDFDVGCIHLDEPLGEKAGWFRIASFPPDQLANWLVNISGYPADKPSLFDPLVGKEQYFHKNRVLHVTDRRLFYDVDTAGGQSGAPVWIQPDPASDPTVVGVHAYGVGGTPKDFNIVANSAPRIIPELLGVIEGWIAKSNESA